MAELKAMTFEWKDGNRSHNLTEKEKDKITVLRYDGDTHFYDVFESKEEQEEEQKRLDKIEKDYQEQMASYLKSLS